MPRHWNDEAVAKAWDTLRATHPDVPMDVDEGAAWLVEHGHQSHADSDSVPQILWTWVMAYLYHDPYDVVKFCASSLEVLGLHDET